MGELGITLVLFGIALILTAINRNLRGICSALSVLADEAVRGEFK